MENEKTNAGSNLAECRRIARVESERLSATVEVSQRIAKLAAERSAALPQLAGKVPGARRAW